MVMMQAIPIIWKVVFSILQKHLKKTWYGKNALPTMTTTSAFLLLADVTKNQHETINVTTAIRGVRPHRSTYRLSLNVTQPPITSK